MAFGKSLELAPFAKISRHIIKPLRLPNPDKPQAEIKLELTISWVPACK
jgi:hypothetical protein